MVMSGCLWEASHSSNLQNVYFVSGPNAFFVGNSITNGSEIALLGGNGFFIQHGADVRLSSVILTGFNCAVRVPNAGDGPKLNVSGLLGFNNVADVIVENPLTTGAINATLDSSLSTIVPGTSLALLLLDPHGDRTAMSGKLLLGDTIDTLTNVSPEIEQGSNLGVIRGGLLSDAGGLALEVGSGSGYVMSGMFPNDHLKYVEWQAQTVILFDNTDNFIFIDEDGSAMTALSEPSLLNSIFVGKARAQNGAVIYLQQIETEADHTGTNLNYSLQQTLGPVYRTGSIVTETFVGSRQLDVSSGTYSYGTHIFHPSGGSQVSFYEVYRHGIGYTIKNPPTNLVDCLNYDDGSGVPASILSTGNHYARHALYVVGDGDKERYLLQLGQTTYFSQVDAENGDIPPMPGTWTGNIVLIASLIVYADTNSIVQIRDERPRIGFKASGISVVTDHGNLSGLLDDDHPQYLLTNGMRAMNGNLNIGTFSIQNVGLVDGVDVSMHAARHLPNGFDPLPTGIPLAVGTINSLGIQNAFARSDHIHAHGDLREIHYMLLQHKHLQDLCLLQIKLFLIP